METVPGGLVSQLPRGWGFWGPASLLPASQVLLLQGLREKNLINRITWVGSEFHIIPTLIDSEHFLIKLTVAVGKGYGALVSADH